MGGRGFGPALPKERNYDEEKNDEEEGSGTESSVHR